MVHKVNPRINTRDIDTRPATLHKKFVQSSYWKEVRLAVLIRDGKKCTVCQSIEELEVHHLSYKHLGSEHLFLGDLVTICRTCHRESHNMQ